VYLPLLVDKEFVCSTNTDFVMSQTTTLLISLMIDDDDDDDDDDNNNNNNNNNNNKRFIINMLITCYTVYVVIKMHNIKTTQMKLYIV